ncbi:MAG: ATPase, partial [Prevotella sp.]|nr:ATPase [Prevotella sp.]
ALDSPITVMETAGEGGAWGIALLAAFVVNNSNGMSLPDWLDNVVFAGNSGSTISPNAEDVEGFNKYLENYKACLPIEKSAVENKK